MGEYFFWYQPTRVVPDQRPLNGRCCCCCIFSSEVTKYGFCHISCEFQQDNKYGCKPITLQKLWLKLLFVNSEITSQHPYYYNIKVFLIIIFKKFQLKAATAVCLLVLPEAMFLTSSWTSTRPSGQAVTSETVSMPSLCRVDVVVTSDWS